MKRYIRSDITDLSDEAYRDKYDTAQDFTVSRRILERLAQDPQMFISQEAQRTLEQIDSGERFITKDVPADILDIFSASARVDVRYYVAKHPNVTDETLYQLLKDEDPRVRAAAKETLSQR